MYLLIPNAQTEINRAAAKFTFHNVSINSKISDLLNVFYPVFTFHNVSINSIWTWLTQAIQKDLHSIMYLLILIKKCYHTIYCIIYIP